jgi:hypothetical protein
MSRKTRRPDGRLAVPGVLTARPSPAKTGPSIISAPSVKCARHSPPARAAAVRPCRRRRAGTPEFRKFSDGKARRHCEHAVASAAAFSLPRRLGSSSATSPQPRYRSDSAVAVGSLGPTEPMGAGVATRGAVDRTRRAGTCPQRTHSA